MLCQPIFVSQSFVVDQLLVPFLRIRHAGKTSLEAFIVFVFHIYNRCFLTSLPWKWEIGSAS